MTKPPFDEAPTEDDPLCEILKRHGITDVHQFLIKHKDAPVDTRPQIDGSPVSYISREEIDARLAGGWKLFWLNVTQRFPWLSLLTGRKPGTCTCDIVQVRKTVQAAHDQVAEDVANDLPSRR